MATSSFDKQFVLTPEAVDVLIELAENPPKQIEHQHTPHRLVSAEDIRRKVLAVQNGILPQNLVNGEVSLRMRRGKKSEKALIRFCYDASTPYDPAQLLRNIAEELQRIANTLDESDDS